MPPVNTDHGLEGFAGSFHEVVTASPMHMHVYAPGEHISAFGIYSGIHTVKQTAMIAYLRDCAIIDHDRTSLDPYSSGEEYLSVVNLSHHK